MNNYDILQEPKSVRDARHQDDQDREGYLDSRFHCLCISNRFQFLIIKIFKMIKTNSKEYKQAVRKYLINYIDLSDYENYEINGDDKYLINSVYEIFTKEYGYLIDQIGEQKAMAEWFSGLPRCIHIEYRHSQMLEIAKQLHGVTELNEKQGDKIIGNWFNHMAYHFLKYRLELNK